MSLSNPITFSRVWAMPNSRTFSIKPIRDVIAKYKAQLRTYVTIIDPFANNSAEGTITNEIAKQTIILMQSSF